VIPWLLVALATVGGAATSLFLRWRLQRAEDDVELWQTQAKRAIDELAGVHVTFRHERERWQEVERVLRDDLAAASRRVRSLAAAHPELRGELFFGVLEDAVAADGGDSGMRPATTAADPAKRGPRED
jgi:hypothetical protein